ncbi:MAG TPA: hypothetical protein VH643_07885 [Gemmataceae bacterium]|jgi:hypothetical protein
MTRSPTRAVLGLVEQRILAMQDGFLQGPLAHVIIQRGTRVTQEQRQLLPVPERVADRAAEGRVGLGELLVELPRQPRMQLLHRRLALVLMELQARLGRQLPPPSEGIVAVHHGEGFEQVAARLGEAIVDVHELPPGMRQAMGQDRLQLARQVARQGIAHLDRRRQFRGAELEHRGQVLAGVPAAAEEQGYPPTVAQRHHPRGEQAAPFVGIGSFSLGTGHSLLAAAPPQLQDLDRGVIVVQHLALGRLPEQLLEGGSQARRHRLHDVPLGRGRQRNPQMPLQAFQAIER